MTKEKEGGGDGREGGEGERREYQCKKRKKNIERLILRRLGTDKPANTITKGKIVKEKKINSEGEERKEIRKEWIGE